MSTSLGITAYLTHLIGSKSVTLAESVAPGELQTTSWINRPFPFSGSGGAPALVASFSDDDIKAMFQVHVKRPGRGLRRSADEFLNAVHQLREEGSVVIREYGENGLASVTSPVLGLAGETAGAVSLVGPLSDVDGRFSQLSHDTKRAAAAISASLATGAPTRAH
jgi:DNA-binding IclR family transcriptional regulator